MMKAPAGGTVSTVNGQFYEGGEFLPQHGLFCGKGRNRVTAEQFNDVARRVAAAGLTLVYRESTAEFLVKETTGNIRFRVASLKTISKLYPA